MAHNRDSGGEEELSFRAEEKENRAKKDTETDRESGISMLKATYA